MYSQRLIFFFVLSALSFKVHSQDPHFSQLNNSQWYFNPAMANNDSLDQVSVKYRNQWPSLSSNYVTTSMSYSHYSPKTNGAVYASFLSDNFNEGTLIKSSFHVGYAQKFCLGQKWMLQLGGEMAYAQRVLDWTNLTFGDMIDPRRGFVYTTSEAQGPGTASYIDISSGLLLSSEKFHLGISAHHLTEPNESVISGSSPLPVKLGVQAGYELTLMPDLDMMLSAFHYRQSDFLNTMLGGDLMIKKKLVLGYYYRLDDAQIFKLGYNGNILNVFYSFDLTTSQLSGSNAYSHEVSAGIKFWSKSPHPCFRNW